VWKSKVTGKVKAMAAGDEVSGNTRVGGKKKPKPNRYLFKNPNREKKTN